MEKSLPSSEWVFVGSILIVMTAFFVVAKVNAYRASSEISIAPLLKEECIVTITGAVSRSGEYTVRVGTTLEQVLKKARPMPYSNLRALPLKKIIETSLLIDVEELTEISVSIDGEVAEPVTLVLAPKSRICDLKSKVIFTDETDKTFFRKRRLLRDGDRITVPKKTVEQNARD